jgi:TRAP-type mannitol/chloroaromatic compound transport system permease large subunit
VELMDIFQGMLPFLGLVMISMVMFYTFPQIGLWLPDVIYGAR